MNDETRLKKAEQASTLAFICVLLCLMVNCGGCFTVFIALPLSLWTLSLARTAMDGYEGDLVQAYARPARNIAVSTAIFSGVLITIMVLYITLYVGMIALIFGAAATIPPPPPAPISAPYNP